MMSMPVIRSTRTQLVQGGGHTLQRGQGGIFAAGVLVRSSDCKFVTQEVNTCCGVGASGQCSKDTVGCSLACCALEKRPDADGL